MSAVETQSNDVELAADIVAAFVSNNSVRVSDLAPLIAAVHQAIAGLSNPAGAEPTVEPQQPAVSIRKSLGDDFIICLEDGRKFKSLKRHLRTAYDLSPDQYRKKWGLPHTYPMVAPTYSRARSTLAKKSGLGQLAKDRDGRKPASPAPVPVKRPRGRPRTAV